MRMSLYLCAVFISAIIIGVPYTYGQQAAADADVQKLQDYFYQKCSRVGASMETFEKLRTDAYDLGKYMDYAFQFLPKKRDIFCDKERAVLNSKMKAVASDLRKCLPEKEMFMANFLKEVFEEFLHFFCHDNGIYTTRLFSSRSKSCNVESFVSRLGSCFDLFSRSRSYITKPEICDDMVVTKKCFARYIEADCSSNQSMIKDLNEQFFRFINKPCAGCVNYLSIFIILGAVLTHLFIP